MDKILASKTENQSDLEVVRRPDGPRTRIDWLTLICEPQEDSFRWAEANHTSMTESRATRTKTNEWYVQDHGKFMYRQVQQAGDGGVLYMFNPSTISHENVKYVMRNFLRPYRISRIDVAIDYWIDLSKHRFDVPRQKRKTYVAAGGEVESVYFGARSGPLYTRCYDRRAQLKLPSTSPPCWRIEVERKPRRGQEPLPQDFFDHIVIGGINGSAAVDFPTRAKLNYLSENPGSERTLCTKTRNALMSLLQENMGTLEPSPAEVYRAERPRLQAELDTLMASGRGGS